MEAMRRNVMKKLFLFLLCFLSLLISSCAEISAPPPSSMAVVSTSALPQKVAILLPLTGQSVLSGQAIRNGFLAAYYYAKQQNQAVNNIQFFDTNNRDIKALYREAITGGADFVVGPLTKAEVSMIASITLAAPTLALNTLNDYQKKVHENLYQFGLSPQDEAAQTASKIRKDGYKRILTITPANSWGSNLNQTFKYNLEKLGGTVVENLSYNKQEDLSLQIARLLKVDLDQMLKKDEQSAAMRKNIDPYLYRRQDFDAIFLVATPEDARQIRPILNFHYAGSIPIYATSQIYDGNPNPQLDSDLNGINFCDAPWVLQNTNDLPSYLKNIQEQIASLWPNSLARSNRLYALGVDAYNLMRFLNKKESFPTRGLEGATGILFKDQYQHIYRRLVWARFQNGVPVLYANSL